MAWRHTSITSPGSAATDLLGVYYSEPTLAGTQRWTLPRTAHTRTRTRGEMKARFRELCDCAAPPVFEAREGDLDAEATTALLMGALACDAGAGKAVKPVAPASHKNGVYQRPRKPEHDGAPTCSALCHYRTDF